MAQADESPAADPSEQRLAQALDQFCAALDAGHDPDPHALLQGHSDLDNLADCLEGLAAMERLRRTLGNGDEPASTPRTLGDYEVLREIGRGGMGVVYEARDRRLGRRVALKMIRSGDLAGPEELARFQAEAQAVASLQHPGIVQIHEVGDHDGRPFLALEFVDGVSLDARLRQAPLPPAAAALLVQNLALAIHFAHRRQVVHRDLKPANVMLPHADGLPLLSPEAPMPGQVACRYEEPKITDFGLAKRLDAAGLTHTGAVLGTPSYMAPEQAAGRTHDVGVATDVYALGAILYETLTGRPPFKAATSLETLRQVLHEEPVPPRRLQPRVPAELETICLKCLHKEPERRYATAEALADDLGRCRRGEPIMARPSGPAGRLWRWCRRHPNVAALTGAAILFFGVAVALWLLHVGDQAARSAEALQRRKDLLRFNVYAAEGVGSTVLLELQHLASAVVAAAEDERVRDCLQKQDYDRLQQLFQEFHDKHADPSRGFVGPEGRPAFHSWHVLDGRGVLRADAPWHPINVAGRDFSNRDYYEGALAHAEATGLAAVHVSRVYQSENDGLHKITLSCRVRGAAGPNAQPLGVVCATIPATRTLGGVRLADEHLKAVLVARRDPKPPRGPAPSPLPVVYQIVIHPGYEERPGSDANRVVEVPAAQLRRIPRSRPGSEFQLTRLLHDFQADDATNDAYEDPVGALQPDAYGGRWLAGFAPVGNTELLVIVQQRDPGAAAEANDWSRAGAIGGSLAALAALLAGGYAWRRRPQTQAAPPIPSEASASTLTQPPQPG